MKIEQQKVPVFLDDKKQPIAGVFFIGGKRILCKIEEMTEEEIIELFSNNK